MWSGESKSETISNMYSALMMTKIKNPRCFLALMNTLILEMKMTQRVVTFQGRRQVFI